MGKFRQQIVPLLKDRTLVRGERWIYSAGFNVPANLSDTMRIDEELSDLRRLIHFGCRIALLSHQGSYGSKNTRHLDFVASYLEKKLSIPVGYFPENATESAVMQAGNISDGCIMIFGNTRFHPGEEKNDRYLSKQFARLGNQVAVGGFCKSHRSHASNVGILDFLHGYVTDGFMDETEQLRPWVGSDKSRPSLAVLGGVKKEKIFGLSSFAGLYDFVMPGGRGLNLILKHMGMDIGDSVTGSVSLNEHQIIRDLMTGPKAVHVLVPEQVLAAPVDADPFTETRLITVGDKIPKGYMIVDFIPTKEMEDILSCIRQETGRMFIAGPPSFYCRGYRTASSVLLDIMSCDGVQSILLGGDSSAELPFSGQFSSGGGAALEYLCTSTTAVWDALSFKNEQGKPNVF